MFEARFQTFDDSSERARKRRARRRLARRAQAPRARRLRRAARRPPAERISARRARSGWPGSPASPARPAPPSCSPTARRCSSTAATPCRPTAQVDTARLRHRASGRQRRRRNGWSRTSRAAPRSATIPGCTPPRAPSSCKKACAEAGAELVAVDGNPIDALWRDRPAPPAGAGGAARRQIRRRKRRRQAQARAAPSSRKLRADVLVVSDPQNVAWAFNIRGADVAHTPLALAFALVPREGRPALYVDARQARQRSARRAGGDRRRARARRSLTAISPRSRARPCGSTRRAPPTR